MKNILETVITIKQDLFTNPYKITINWGNYTSFGYCSSIRGSHTEMQHLMKLLERDQYINWHRLKDEDVVRDIFLCHPDAVKL